MTDYSSQDLSADAFDCSSQLDLFGTPELSIEMPRFAPETSDEPALCRIGHDLRTALNAILGFSEIMTQGLHGPLGHPKYDEYAQHVRFSGQALLSVTDEVMALAGRRISGGSPALRV